MSFALEIVARLPCLAGIAAATLQRRVLAVYPRLTVDTLLPPLPRSFFSSGLVDVGLVALLTSVWHLSQEAAALALPISYLLLRESIHGRSVGKVLAGLVVLDARTREPADWRRSLLRNVLVGP